MRIIKKNFIEKVHANLAAKGLVTEGTDLDSIEDIVEVVFGTLKESLQTPEVKLFNHWGLRIKKSILPPRNLVNLRNRSELIQVPEKVRYYLKITE